MSAGPFTNLVLSRANGHRTIYEGTYLLRLCSGSTFGYERDRTTAPVTSPYIIAEPFYYCSRIIARQLQLHGHTSLLCWEEDVLSKISEEQVRSSYSKARDVH